MQSLILSAGLGTRLRPFTNYIPKPLFPFFDSTILELNYNKVDKISSHVAINVHHLPDSFEGFLQANPNVHVSKENPILGTGGAIRHLDHWLKKNEEDFFICNADVISDANFEALYEEHRLQKNAVTMLMLPEQIPGTSAVAIGLDKDILAIGDSAVKKITQKYTKHTYGCAIILKSGLISKIPKGFGDLWPAVNFAIENQLRVKSFIHEGFWEDIGTPKAFYDFAKSFAHKILDKEIHNPELFGFSQKFKQDSFKELYVNFDPDKSGSFSLALQQNFWSKISTAKRHHFKSCIFLSENLSTPIPEGTKNSLISDRDIVLCNH